MYVGHKNYPTFNRCPVVQNEWHNEDVKATLTSSSLDIRIFGIRAFDTIIRLLHSYSSIVCPCITLVRNLGEARPNHLPVFWKPRPLLLTTPSSIVISSSDIFGNEEICDYVTYKIYICTYIIIISLLMSNDNRDLIGLVVVGGGLSPLILVLHTFLLLRRKNWDIPLSASPRNGYDVRESDKPLHRR